MLRVTRGRRHRAGAGRPDGPRPGRAPRRWTRGRRRCEGDRLAYQLSTGGDEESRLYVLDVATGELLDGPVDRCRYSPVAWLPGGEELFYVRRLAPDARAGRRGAVPPPRLAAPGRRRPRRPTSWCTARAATRPPTSACAPAPTAAGWSSPARSGTAPRDDVWLADLAGRRRRCASSRSASTRRPRPGWPATAGCGCMSDRDTPRWRLAVADPADPATWAPEAWREVVPQQPDAVLSDVTLVDGPDGALQVLAVHAVDATDRLSVWAADGSRPDRARCPPRAPAASPASAPRPRAAPSAWVGYTDYATPPSVLRWDAGSPGGARATGSGPPSPATSRS